MKTLHCDLIYYLVQKVHGYYFLKYRLIKFSPYLFLVSPSQQSLLSTASDLQQSEPVKKTSTFLRKKFAEGNDSSFEDIVNESEKGSGTSL